MANRRCWMKFGYETMSSLNELNTLAEALGVPAAEAAAYIGFLIAYGIEYGEDDGTIDHLTDGHIERACMWEGERSALIGGFVAAGVLIGERDSFKAPLAINPRIWKELAEDAIKGRQNARKRQAENRSDKEPCSNN